jgi:hypothetical protein
VGVLISQNKAFLRGHCGVFIQKWQILPRGKAAPEKYASHFTGQAQGFWPRSRFRGGIRRGRPFHKPQAQTREERRLGAKDAIYGWTIIKLKEIEVLADNPCKSRRYHHFVA